MEIRRIEPERITPPAASEHGARVENSRRQRQPREGKPQERETDEHGRSQAPEEEVAVDRPAATVYQADGQLREPPSPGSESHTIDFTV